MNMHGIYLYVRYTNSYVLLSDWRTVAKKLVCINRKGPIELEFPKGAKKMVVVVVGVMETLKIVG